VQFLALEKVAAIHRFAAPVRSGKAVEVLGNRQTIIALLWARRFPSVPIELEFVVLAMKGVQRTNFMLFSYVIGRKKRKKWRGLKFFLRMATESSLGPSWLNKKMGCYSNTVQWLASEMCGRMRKLVYASAWR
jgi:hypothetical protein